MTRGRTPAKGLAPRICEVCGTEYQPYRANQTACSRECARKTERYRELQRKSDRRPERQARKNELRRGRAQAPHSRETIRRMNLAKRGWTIPLYEQKLAEQDGKCHLCGATPDPNGIKAAAKLHADHDHVTRLPRDLLCGRCNVGIGMFRDDPALMRKAAEYIERHRAAVQQEEATSG